MFSKKPTQPLPHTFSLQNLFKETHAHAFNIEAGKPALALRAGAIWVNLAMIVDASIVTGVTLEMIDKISDQMGYPLKEMAIDEYDELKVNLATLLIMTHYLKEGRRLVNKSAEEALTFVVHTHRASTAIYINKLIARLLMEAVPGHYQPVYKAAKGRNGTVLEDIDRLEMPDNNTIIHFRRGFAEELTDPLYQQADVLFSYSIVGGLSHLLPSAMLIPHEFTPLEEKTLTLREDKTYSVTNHLLTELDKVLAQPQEQYLALLDKSFGSKNLNKQFKARVLTKDDFYPTKLLQVYDLFHPVVKKGEPDRMVTVVKAENPVTASAAKQSCL